ncbi:MAG: T9SS type A sorting domain-containing protein [Tannerella sp.]|jgi:hypothetical protein|nr:T9SS type A sorting domain-containing protein [Tannerella sp.]
MKTKLLTLCLAFPVLLSAQNVVKKTTNEFQLFSNLENQQAMLNSAASQLPDSIYTYADSEYEYLEAKAAFTYDAEGRVILEKGVKVISGYSNPQTPYKKDYTYTIESDSSDTEEIIESHLVNGQWQKKYKNTTYSRSNNPTSTKMIVETKKYYYIYAINNDNWKLEQSTTTTDFSDKGYPVVMVDSIRSTDGLVLYKNEISYNENNQVDSIISHRPNKADKNKWDLFSKSKYTYNIDGKLTKIRGYYTYISGEHTLEWYRTTDYEYDEKGNLASKDILDDDIMYSYYYKNVYSSTASNQIPDPVKLSEVYTDPAGNIIININDSESATVYINNMAGHLIWKQAVSSQRTTIPTNNLSKGIYIVKVETIKSSDTYKISVK